MTNIDFVAEHYDIGNRLPCHTTRQQFKGDAHSGFIREVRTA
jgi:hypothetical protein